MNGYISADVEIFPNASAAIDQAAERHAERVARERATVVRGDGSPVYAIQEHEEREAAILEAPGAGTAITCPFTIEDAEERNGDA